ncbi:MAG TPA: hypothetical protein VG452_08515, partial [Egibacteraceae bacterium]|nr:hypothetical protein [Egibacteraceae bacterium]
AAVARRRDAGGLVRLGAGAAAAVAACTLPFAAQPQALAFPYRFHAARGVSAESLPYLALRLTGLADRPARAWFEATVPPWAPEATLAVLAAVLFALLVAAWRRPMAAVPLAAASVAAFLLGNRVFSPQFLLPLAALWAVGLAVRAGTGRGPALAVLLAVAATANWAVWPVASAAYVALGWVLFAAALAASVLAFAPARPPG